MGKKLLDKIKITPLKIVKLSSGNIMHILKKNELKNWTFGEAYFSKIKFNKVKAWKYHLKMTLNLTFPNGTAKFSVIFKWYFHALTLLNFILEK
jgi:dTDP-4-dehydrorhamnose 3,5-epimerase